MSYLMKQEPTIFLTENTSIKTDFIKTINIGLIRHSSKVQPSVSTNIFQSGGQKGWSTGRSSR